LLRKYSLCPIKIVAQKYFPSSFSWHSLYR